MNLKVLQGDLDMVEQVSKGTGLICREISCTNIADGITLLSDALDPPEYYDIASLIVRVTLC